MTTDLTQAASASARMPGAPYSRTLRVVAGASLVLAGLLNGATQYVGHLLIGDLDSAIRSAGEQTIRCRTRSSRRCCCW